MKAVGSLRSKLLISFCLTEVVIIALLMLVVSDRFRTGLDRSQAIPTLAIGFAMSGDLWAKDDK